MNQCFLKYILPFFYILPVGAALAVTSESFPLVTRLPVRTVEPVFQLLQLIYTAAYLRFLQGIAEAAWSAA